jgi:hypothetical protein
VSRRKRMTPAERLADIEASLRAMKEGRAPTQSVTQKRRQKFPREQPVALRIAMAERAGPAPRWVYFIRCTTTQLVKIGSSIDPIQRLRTALVTSSTPLVLERVIAAGFNEEYTLQELFRAQGKHSARHSSWHRKSWPRWTSRTARYRMPLWTCSAAPPLHICCRNSRRTSKPLHRRAPKEPAGPSTRPIRTRYA